MTMKQACSFEQADQFCISQNRKRTFQPDLAKETQFLARCMESNIKTTEQHVGWYFVFIYIRHHICTCRKEGPRVMILISQFMSVYVNISACYATPHHEEHPHNSIFFCVTQSGYNDLVGTSIFHIT